MYHIIFFSSITISVIVFVNIFISYIVCVCTREVNETLHIFNVIFYSHMPFEDVEPVKQLISHIYILLEYRYPYQIQRYIVNGIEFRAEEIAALHFTCHFCIIFFYVVKPL